MSCNQTADRVRERYAEKVRKEALLLTKFESPKLVDLIISKQTQYYTLWAIYTVVQFAAGNFSSNQKLPLWGIIAVLLGVWTFNLGHLGFVLQCVEQISKLRRALNLALIGNKEEYQLALRNAFENMNEADYFWRFYRIKKDRFSYIMNSVVHFIIDICASLALIIRNS